MSTYRLTRRGERVRDALLMALAGVLVGVLAGLTLCSPFMVYLGGAR